MQKKTLLALALVMTLLLSGCTLVQKDPEVDAKTEIIRYGDTVVTKGEIQDEVKNELDYMSYLYSLYGYPYDKTSAENIAEVQKSVIDNHKAELVKGEKIKELGLDQLTAEEEDEIRTNAEKNYQDSVDYFISDNEDLADLSEEEKTAKAKEQLETQGFTPESALESAREQALEDKLREEIIKDVTVEDSEIQADYDSKVASAKETYENNPGNWASAANNGTTLYYTPAGVRFVKQILVKFTEEDQTKIDEAGKKVTDAQTKLTAAQTKVSDAQAALDSAQAVLDDAEASQESRDAATENKTAAQKDLEAAQAEVTAAQAEADAAQAAADEATDTAFANIDSAADEILAQIAGGADWDTLMAEKGEDPGMKSGRTAERGYAVSADMTSFDSAFVKAAMELEKIGDVSGKIRGTTYGYYIIKYVSDAAEGPIDLDEVKESIRSSLLSTNQNKTYNDTVDGWVKEAEAKFRIDLNALN